MPLIRYRLSTRARADVVDILARTHEHFGELARLRYEHLLVTALQDLARRPDRIGTIGRPERGAAPDPLSRRPACE